MKSVLSGRLLLPAALLSMLGTLACSSAPPSSSPTASERVGSLSQPLSFNLLHSFAINGADGSSTDCGVTLAGSTLYGMATRGGTEDMGTVFKMNTDGTGFSVLHSFAGSTADDGQYPHSTLTLSGSSLFGTTQLGGFWNGGSVFELSTDGTEFSLVHSFFGGTADGQAPSGSVTLSGSILYGMTIEGGFWDRGTVFKVNTDGTEFSVLHSFKGGTADGQAPYGSLTLSGTTLYGMTSAGGASNLGTVFKVNTDGTGFSLLRSFAGGTADGQTPVGSLTLSGSTLYGTTFQGGASNLGTAFKMNTDGTGFALLHSFNGGTIDGEGPGSSLALSGSALYGTTPRGGASNQGTVFNLHTDGTAFSLLHSFANGTTDGQNPGGPPTLSGSTLYGMTWFGGTSGTGTVFKLDLTCDVDKHVASNVCVTCAPGSTRPAGDDPTAADTTCIATVCTVNQHVASHACLECALGSTRPSGDLASDADTTCTAIVCAANEHVVSHACIVCPPGSIRPAGDLATGVDTECAVEPIDSGVAPDSGTSSGSTADSGNGPTDSGVSPVEDAGGNDASTGCSCTTFGATATSQGSAGVAVLAAIAIAARRVRRRVNRIGAEP